MSTKKIAAFFAILIAILISPKLVHATTDTRIQHINWTFSVYAEPDFRAQRINTFTPQYVTIVDDNSDGWVLVSTVQGYLWTYTGANMRFIDRTMGIYESIGDTRHIDIISPQVVSILAQEGRWLQISTWQGPRWINLDFAPPTADIRALLTRHGSNLALFYKNIETGFTFTHNPDRVFFGASLTKANHALYVYTLAERGMIDLDTVHTFTSADMRGGTGRIQHMATGTQFTTRQLLQHSMLHSCNVAFGMLVRHTAGVELSYHDFVYELGARNFPGNLSSHLNATAADTALWMYAIHNYIESDSQFGHYFRYDLLATPGFIQSDHPMARKYGWATASFHDAAVVYAPSPYILVIMSNMDDGAHNLFGNISWRMQEFNAVWFD